MAITHANFLTQVRNYTEVDANVLSDSIIQDFIRNVELDVAGKVDYDDLRKYATSTFTAGNRAVSMPSDALILRSIEHIGSGGDRVFLEKRDTSFISEFNGSGVQGTPKYYANWNEFNIIVAPTPASADTVQINYIKDPPEFTSTNQTYLAKLPYNKWVEEDVRSMMMVYLEWLYHRLLQTNNLKETNNGNYNKCNL
jgi:hypothetical protein